MTHPNLNRLNELLKDPKFELPVHRQRVDASGHNLKFVRKVIPAHPKACDEIKTLLAMKDKELMCVSKANA